MDHKVLETKATITDLGEFTAIAAAYSVDRMNERILPGAFKGTIGRWQESGKQIPLHWDHSGSAEDIIGTVDPASMNETDEGLEVKGKLDLEDSEVAREAWRSMKKNRIGLSFGYLVTDDGEGEDGIRELKAVDLFEVSVTPAPANPDTRFIDMKSATASSGTDAQVTIKPDGTVTGNAVWEKWAAEHIVEDDPATQEKKAQELKSGYDKVAIDLMAVGVNPETKADSPPAEDDPSQDVKGLESVPTLESERKMAPSREQRTTAVEDAHGEEPEKAKPQAQDPLRKRYDELALELTTRGIDVGEPPKVEEEPEPEEDQPSMAELRRKSYDLMLETLIGSEKP